MNQQLKKIIVSFSRRDFIVQCIKLILALPVTMATIRRYAFAAQYGQVFIKEAPMKLPHPEIKGKCTLEKAIQYGKRGIRYAYIEAGHIGQNIFLQAEALGLRAGIVGAFHDKDIRRVMKIPHSHEPLLMMPVGYER